MVLIHSLTNMPEVDVLYKGIENTNPDMEHIGALAALRDLRDGSNLTGLNPGNEKLIRHIGFSGHYSSPTMMEMIRRPMRLCSMKLMLPAIHGQRRHW